MITTTHPAWFFLLSAEAGMAAALIITIIHTAQRTFQETKQGNQKKMSATQTSLEAYRNAHISPNQKKILRLLHHSPRPLSNYEISQILQLPINTVTPRIYELRQIGKITRAGTKQINGRTHNTWQHTRKQNNRMY